MEPTTREMVRQTIRALQAGERLARMSKVEREAEAVRLAKQGGTH